MSRRQKLVFPLIYALDYEFRFFFGWVNASSAQRSAIVDYESLTRLRGGRSTAAFEGLENDGGKGTYGRANAAMSPNRGHKMGGNAVFTS